MKSSQTFCTCRTIRPVPWTSKSQRLETYFPYFVAVLWISRALASKTFHGPFTQIHHADIAGSSIRCVTKLCKSAFVGFRGFTVQIPERYGPEMNHTEAHPSRVHSERAISVAMFFVACCTCGQRIVVEKQKEVAKNK